jgi:hypothetical protein
LPLARLAAYACFFFGALLSSGLAADGSDIYFKTSPRIELLQPFADAVDLSLLITGAGGKPVKDGTVAIRLDAPARGYLFSTDFPLVEGTSLNEMRLPLRQGKANWKYLFPIRGNYQLSVEAIAEDGTKLSKTFVFKVRESRQKLWALAGFSAALLVLGIAAGRIFTRTGGAVILLIASALAAALPASSHVPAPSGPPTQGLEIEPATVGKASLVRWTAPETVRREQTNRFLSLSILHLEKQKIVFAVDKIPVGDEWSMKFHFPDGAGYRVSAVAEATGQPLLRSEQVIAVTGVEPPAKAMVPALSYFVGLIAVGLGAGRWTKRRAAVSEAV